MKKARIAVVLLLGVVLIVGIACGEAKEPVSTPTVGNIPQGWYLSDEEPYGTMEESDGTEWGVIEYTDAEDADFVTIYYGDVPSELKGHETEGDALVEQAIEWSIFEPDETGTMVAAGQIAGYTKVYESAMEANEMEIVFIVGSTCIDIYTVYDATTENEAQVMSIIDSISIK